jgi:membrane protease YdiL (CAAX protease family)
LTHRPGGPRPTGPSPAGPDASADSGAPTATEAPTTPRRPFGLFRFTVEGRRAPGLFVAGWLATLVGVGALLILGPAEASVASVSLTIVALTVLSVGLFLLGGSQTIERRAAGIAYAGPSPLLLLAAVWSLSRLVAYVVGVPLALAGVAIPREAGDLLAAILQAAVFLGVVRLMVVGPGVMRPAEMGLGGGLRDLGHGLATGALFVGPVLLVSVLVSNLAISLAGTAPPPSPLPPTGTPAGLILHLIAGAMVAPVAEEVLFRGAVLTAWLRTAGPQAAIVRSSLVFVLAHALLVEAGSFDEGIRLALVSGAVRLPVALALGWLYVRTGRLWAPMGLHALFNGILIAMGEAVASG